MQEISFVMTESKNKGLLPNVGYNDFALGRNVADYLDRPHTLRHFEPTFLSDTYHFDDEDIDLWCNEDGTIYTIRCLSSCIYQGVELIGMPYEEFLQLMQIDYPDEIGSLYMMDADGKGHSEDVAGFHDLGLQVWVDNQRVSIYVEDISGPIVNVFIVSSFDEDD